MKSVAMLPAEGGPSRTRDGSIVSSALLGDAHTHTHTVHAHAMYVFVWHACMHVCVCWQPRAGGFGGAGCVCVVLAPAESLSLLFSPFYFSIHSRVLVQ